MNTIPGIEASNMKFRFTRIILNSALTALSFTQALAWKNAIDKLFALFFPEDTDGVVSPFVIATVVTSACVGFAWVASRCLKGLEDHVENLSNIAEVEIVQVSNRRRSNRR